nr:Rv3235 family protein [Curtobacterium pusillum]
MWTTPPCPQPARCRISHVVLALRSARTKGAGVAEQARRIDDEEPTAEVARLSVVPPPTDVEDTARALGLCVAEILTGAREVDSIARWVTDDVHRHLQQRAAVAARARQLGGRSRARALLRVGSVVVCRPADGVAEATVVVHTRSHARAVAMRLEERQGRWRATAVGVL